jgi:hypothetical protein
MLIPTLRQDYTHLDPVLICPNCQSEYLHPKFSKTPSNQSNGFFENPVGIYKQYDRGYISIKFDCECCDAEPELVIFNHKGFCHFKWHSIRKEI